MAVFTRFLSIELPDSLTCDESGRNPAFEIAFSADGEIPFPQVILHGQSGRHIIKDNDIFVSDRSDKEVSYVAVVDSGVVRAGEVRVQVEGCKKEDFRNSGGGDWVKEFRTLKLAGQPRPARAVSAAGGGEPVKVYYGIHKHMHQPYYNATDLEYWDGEKDGIFGSRGGNYTDFVPMAVRQYIEGGLPHGGLSTTWSGSLIEQLNRCAERGWCGGRFNGWNNALREVAGEKTALGNPRIEFSAFGFYHPLMPLIPHRDIVRQIEWHRDVIREAFGVEASRVMFPPETAFHVRMIPALVEAGVDVVMYDSIHRYRTCKDYPYAGKNEGMLPPNPADQVNPPVDDWFQMNNIWAASKIAPSLMKPEYIEYVNPDGKSYKIIGVPAERYLGNEDARGGFGALQYPDVLGQVYDQIVATGTFDPKHPPFFVLHSDGDNHGGGADSYYGSNTGAMVRWLHEDPRFELTTVSDYLQRFPPDPSKTVHVEPGSWAGADNGDPQFMKWFSRYDQPYSPDLNSWAVLTAMQNLVHALEDARPNTEGLHEAWRLMLTAQTSCYWYWTGQHVWDQQVTNAANLGYQRLKSAVDGLLSAGKDATGPTIFAPWVIPENPGGKKWGNNCLLDAPREGRVYTFIYDIAGLERVNIVIRGPNGETTMRMTDHGPYPSETGAAITSSMFTADLPVGAGDLRYYIEAEDRAGNVSRSALERVFMA
ncbi:MAG: glycosyl hydrolase family 57 [Alphaproteobacteria bacterium]|jgi:hypothetical protein|nr:glycosyl hydrolase family 57 [Alphaproteobacteria bacterium]